MSLRGHAIVYVAGALPPIAFVAAVAALDAERNADGSSIPGFGDAVWWACTTMRSVGYGDRYLVTGEGRLIAVGLMLSGIALRGVVTAALASCSWRGSKQSRRPAVRRRMRSPCY